MLFGIKPGIIWKKQTKAKKRHFERANFGSSNHHTLLSEISPRVGVESELNKQVPSQGQKPKAHWCVSSFTHQVNCQKEKNNFKS